MDIKGKIALVTGASSGIGEAISIHLAEKGARVVLTARRTARLKEITDRINQSGGTAMYHSMDVTSMESVKTCTISVEEQWGEIDILVNNAGVMLMSMADQMKYDDWMQMIDVNIKGPINCLYAILPGMLEKKAGHVINISSTAGKKLFPGGAFYCMTKYALRALNEGLRMELNKAHHIRITSIEPGLVKTEFPQRMTDEGMKKSFEEAFKMDILEPHDVAEAVSFALEQAERVNMTEIMVEPTYR